jgi:hypothetical protein
MPITFPSVLSHHAAEAFPDTHDINLYYLVPNAPTLRIDHELPVFRGLFWTGELDADPARTVAGMAGGELNFDVNLAVSQADQDDIRHQLEAADVQGQRAAIVEREENERLSRLARATGEPVGQPRIPPRGPIRFGSIQYLDGRVVLLEKQGDDFIEYSSSGGPPSLMGLNNAAFSLRLGPTGSAVWYRALEQDATALGVRYELEFEVTVPSIEVHIWAGSREKLELERDVERVITRLDRGCPLGSHDVEHIDVKEISQTLHQEGLINIEINKGSTKISDDIAGRLTTMGLDLISERVKQVIMTRLVGLTEEERRTGMQREVTDELSAFAELRLRQTDVVKWNVNPQATLINFLGGVTGDRRKQLITLVDLSNPIAAVLEVPINVNAGWDNDPAITKVEVTVSYPEAAFEDDRTQAATLTKSENTKTLRWRRHRGKGSALDWSAKAWISGVGKPVPVGTGTTNGPVNVEVPALGRLLVRLRPYSEDFALKGAAKIESVQVDYEYGQDGADSHFRDRVVLHPTDSDSGVVVDHRIDTEANGPVQLTPSYILSEGGSVTGAVINAWARAGREARVDLPSAWPDRLRVGARVRPGIPGLSSVKVRLRHSENGGAFTTQADMLLDADVDWEATTSVPQSDRRETRFQYQYSVRGDDQLEESPWLDGDGDGELPVLPILAVRIRPGQLGLGTRFTSAVVKLTYRDQPRNWTVTRELFITDPAATPVWLVPRADQLNDTYRYQLTLFNGEAIPIGLTEVEASGENLILRAPSA